MTRGQWIGRCAKRLQVLNGSDKKAAWVTAAELADQQADLHGSSGLAWQSPEDVADQFVADEEDMQ